MKKKLLAISWAMPPLAFPRSIQVSRLLSELSTLGWDITVLCSDLAQLDQYKDDSLISIYQNRYKKVTVPTSPDDLLKEDVLFRHWLHPAKAAAEKILKENDFNLLITFAQPWVDHLIGLELSKNFSIPWIAHFSDPWVDSIYYSNKTAETISEWHQLERQIIKKAHTVVWTNKQAMQLVMSKYPHSYLNKCRVIPHCFDRHVLEINKKNIMKKRNILKNSTMNFRNASYFLKKKCRLVYTGDFYGPRSPEPLFNGLKILKKNNPELAKKILVLLIGSIPEKYEKMTVELEIDKMIKIFPKTTYLESLRYANLADALLLIDITSDTPYPYLPSKLIDYLMFQKPIIGITPVNGAPADVLSSLDCMVADPVDIESIYDILWKTIIQWQQKNLHVSSRFNHNSDAYSMQSVGLDFNKVIENTLKNPS